MISIVQERPEHVEAVRQLTVDAFTGSEFGHNGEAELIDSLRDQSDKVVSLVAIDDRDVIGHILFSSATIRSKSEIFYGMGLAPMAVIPAHQGCGVGGMLIREGLRCVTESNAAFVVVSGHPEYYPRFGFRPAKELSVSHGFSEMSQEILFIALLDETLDSKLKGGLVYYHSAFGPQHE